MLYKYRFIKYREMRTLSFHFLYFIRSIRLVAKRAPFVPSVFFHKTFLDKNGNIAPYKREAKKLESKFKRFFDDFKKLKPESRNEFYRLIVLSKDIHLYFENDQFTDIAEIKNDNIKRIIGSDSFKELMYALWDNLRTCNAWEIDNHYEAFYKKLPPSKMCPFCGLDSISEKELFKSDYDHIAYKGDYPTSAINIKNLAPTCGKCNQKFKTTKDVLFDDNGHRRRFTYPYIYNGDYEIQKIDINLIGSIIPNTEINNTEGFWRVSIIPDNKFTQTWNWVYSIQRRYIDAIKHDKWIRELIDIIKLNNKHFNDLNEVRLYIDSYKEMFNPQHLEIEYHLKYGYFAFLVQSNNKIFYTQIIERSA